jgi:glutathione peroxidase-family protein
LKGLEALYKKHNNKLTIVGFPSNDFNQEFSSDKEIQDFCKLTYAVEFPMMSKSSVIGKNANPCLSISIRKDWQGSYVEFLQIFSNARCI